MKYFAIIFLMMAVYACAGPKKELLPPPTIEQDKFADVLVDVRLLEGAYTVRYQRVDSTVGLLDHFYDQVFTKHKIRKEDFETSYKAYSIDAKVMQVIEDTVLARLERIKIDIPGDSVKVYKN